MGRKYTAQEVIEALDGTGGILGTVAEKLKCTTRTIQNYIADYPSVKEAWRSERLKLRSMAERSIAQQARAGNLKAAIFIVNQLDPETGEFVSPLQRMEISGPKGDDLAVRVVNYRNGLTQLAPRPNDDSDAPGEN